MQTQVTSAPFKWHSVAMWVVVRHFPLKSLKVPFSKCCLSLTHTHSPKGKNPQGKYSKSFISDGVPFFFHALEDSIW